MQPASRACPHCRDTEDAHPWAGDGLSASGVSGTSCLCCLSFPVAQTQHSQLLCADLDVFPSVRLAGFCSLPRASTVLIRPGAAKGDTGKAETPNLCCAGGRSRCVHPACSSGCLSHCMGSVTYGGAGGTGVAGVGFGLLVRREVCLLGMVEKPCLCQALTCISCRC